MRTKKITRSLDLEPADYDAIQQRATLNGVSWAEVARTLIKNALGVSDFSYTNEIDPNVFRDLIRRIEKLEQQCGQPTQPKSNQVNTNQPKPRIGTHFAYINTDADSEENQEWRKQFREKRIDPTDKPTL